MPKILQAISACLLRKELTEVQTISYIQKCQLVGKIVNEILFAIKPNNNTNWR